MLEAYFDESGTHQNPRESLLIVAGYIADEEKWNAFNIRWKTVLTGFGLTRFHMKDIRNSRHPLFKHLSEPDRRELIIKLIDAIADTALLGTLAYLRPHDYKSATDPTFRSRYGSTYGMLVILTLLQLDSVLLNPIQHPEAINVFLEEGHANANDALRLCGYWQEDTMPAPTEYHGEPVQVVKADPIRTSHMRIAGYGLGSKDGMYPLHAADMLAYLASATLSFKGDGFLTGLFDQLLSRVPHLSTSWNRKAIEKIVARVRRGEEEKRAIRASLYDFKKYLRSHSLKITELPWGVMIDRRHVSEKEWAEIKQRIKADLKANAPRAED